MLDLHVHTTFSDGSCTIREACEAASMQGLSTLAISDHFTTTWKMSVINTLSFETIPEYLHLIESARSDFSFKILRGIEIDCESDWGLVLKIPLSRFDLINFEYVTTFKQINKIIELKKQQDLSSIRFALAHPSVFSLLSGKNLDTFMTILAENDIAVELNSRYPTYFLEVEPTFRLLIKRNVTFSIGSDAHSRQDIGKVQEQYGFLQRLGGTKLIISL